MEVPLEARRRGEFVEFILRGAGLWAAGRPDILALALVGSWARHRERLDSDVDLMLLTNAPALYTEQEAWVSGLGGSNVVLTREWDAITERRFALLSGLEVEVGIGLPSWASMEPVDPGTRRVVRDGFHILYDPKGLLAALAAACGLTPEQSGQIVSLRSGSR